ncbi:MAG: hypothetical protein H6Q59_3101 [Firmicutes bacterium]|nr:hypothetical protein [Bacillota bacterium]
MRKKVTGFIFIITILITTMMFPVKNAEAASKDITVEEFIENLVLGINLDVTGEATEPYIVAASKAGILLSTDFNNDFSGYITRADAAVLLNRADEYLHGNTLDEKLLNWVLTKRISDINKIPQEKREAVAKCVAKGIIKGYSNGYYIQNRAFRGTEYLTESAAKTYIKLITNTTGRAKLCPDGMMIRTTNLPKNANSYEYILECYPNKFYEKKFEFMLDNDWMTDTDDWAYPVEMKNETFRNWYNEWPLVEEMDKYLYDWAYLAERYLQYVFNVDYRTVDNKWINGLASLYSKSNLNESEDIKTYYLNNMKSNKVVIESTIIAVEPSIFYIDNDYCMRAYVKYRIIASDISVDQYKLLYAQLPDLKNLKNGVWRTGIFDIRFGTNNGSTGDGSDFAIEDVAFVFSDSKNLPVE